MLDLVLIVLMAGFAILTLVMAYQAFAEYIAAKRATLTRQDIYVTSCKSCYFTFSGTDQFKVFQEYANHYKKAHQ